jgi:hypothetical protein
MFTRELQKIMYSSEKKDPEAEELEIFSHPMSKTSQKIVYLFASVLSAFSAHAISFPVKGILHIPSRFLLHSLFNSEDVCSSFFQNTTKFFRPSHHVTRQKIAIAITSCLFLTESNLVTYNMTILIFADMVFIFASK